jgi:hypothetical protein
MGYGFAKLTFKKLPGILNVGEFSRKIGKSEELVVGV